MGEGWQCRAGPLPDWSWLCSTQGTLGTESMRCRGAVPKHPGTESASGREAVWLAQQHRLWNVQTPVI